MTHETAIELLPWLVNDSLAIAEADAVQAHAASCIICRRELAELEVLHESISRAAANIEAPEPDMRRINARIDARIASSRREWLPALRRAARNPWFIAFAAQSVAVLVFAVLWLRPDPPESVFRTLTTVEALPAGHYLRVVFDPTIDAASVTELLNANALIASSGPSERGVITLRFADAVTGAERDAIIAAMQDDVRILFVQPVEGGD